MDWLCGTDKRLRVLYTTPVVRLSTILLSRRRESLHAFDLDIFCYRSNWIYKNLTQKDELNRDIESRR